MKKNTIIINAVVLLLIGVAIVWNNYQPSEKTEKSKTEEVKTPVTGQMSKMPKVKKEKSPDVEALYQEVIKGGIPDKMVSMIKLFIEQRLEMEPDKQINLEPVDTETTTAFDLTWRDQGQDYKMHVAIDKEEASYTVEKSIFPYEVALFVDNEVKLQFTGHMNLNYPEPIFQDLDVIGYQSGEWEKNIKKLTITN